MGGWFIPRENPYPDSTLEKKKTKVSRATGAFYVKAAILEPAIEVIKVLMTGYVTRK